MGYARRRHTLAGGCLIACALAACGGGTPALGFAVAVQVEFDDSTISDAALASVTSLEVAVSGGEQFMKTLTPGRSFQRVEKFVYDPMSTTRTLSLVIDALDGTGERVGDGQSATLTLSPGQTQEISVVVVGASGSDMGSTDMPSSCGAMNQLCCSGATCDTPLACDKVTSMCSACGGTGEPCCAGNLCTTSGISCKGGTCK